jgi:hypothetical protein
MLGNLLIRYQKHCETEENHRDDQLKTHYYKGSYRQIFGMVENLLNQDHTYQIDHVSKERGEFSVVLKNGKSLFFIITLVAVKPNEVAVDIHISTETFSLTGSYPILRNEIVTIYQKLNKIAPLIGTGRSI